MSSLPAEYLHGVELFNRGEYFACHEALEGLWQSAAGEEREFLHGLHNIQNALASKDMKGLAVTAKDMMPLMERMPPSLKERFPEAFSEMALAQSEAFRSLARIGESNGEVGAALEQTAEILTYCSGCHDTYRFEVRAPARTRK